MKRLVGSIILVLMLAISIPVLAQDEQITVPKSLLSKDQLEQVTAKQLADKVQHYGSWVGIGHELGTAVNESLTAVTTQANTFANTPVGKLTAALVVWKVIGHDAMGFVIGALEIILIFPLWVWSYRRFLPRSVLDQEVFDPSTGKRIGRTYKTINSVSDENCQGYLIGHYVMLLLLFIVAMITMWA